MAQSASLESRRYPATLTERREIARDTYECTLQIANGFRYESGQYLWLICPKLLVTDPRGDRRAFSIVNPPLGAGVTREVKIIFRASGSGFKQTLLRMPIGSSVFVEAPFGSAFMMPSDWYVRGAESQSIVLIAGGVGISCFLSLLRSPDIMASRVISHLVYANSSLDRACFVDELQSITAAAHIVYTNVFGDFEPTHLPDTVRAERDLFFVCGPQGFVDAVYQALIARGVSDDRIVFEENRPSTPVQFIV